MNDLLERIPAATTPTPDNSGHFHWRWPRLTGPRVVAAIAALLVLLVVVAIAIGGGGSGSGGRESAGSSGSSGSSVASVPRALPAVGGGATSAAGARAPDAPAVPAAPGVPSVVPPVGGAKVVKTGEMDLQVGKGQVPHTLDRLTAIATVQRGYVADSHTSEGIDPSGSVTLRVPVGSFESTVVQVRQLTAKVLSQQIAGADVTGKYVDLQARLRSLQATRAAFERLLARATTIGETLTVQSRITDIQTQIEQLQGELRVLGDQTSYGTLTVSVSEKASIAPQPKPAHRSGMSAAVHRSVDRFVHGIEAIVGILGPLLLVALVAAVGWLLVRLGYRVVRRREV